MTLKVGQDYHEVVVGQVATNAVNLQVLAAGDRNLHRAFLVHDVDLSDRIKAVILDHLTVGQGRGARAAVSSVALDDGAVKLLDQVLDESWVKMVVITSFTGGELEGDLARWNAA